jgi:hypothetical protein
LLFYATESSPKWDQAGEIFFDRVCMNMYSSEPTRCKADVSQNGDLCCRETRVLTYASGHLRKVNVDNFLEACVGLDAQLTRRA